MADRAADEFQASLDAALDAIPEHPPGTFGNSWSDEPPVTLQLSPHPLGAGPPRALSPAELSRWRKARHPLGETG